MSGFWPTVDVTPPGYYDDEEDQMVDYTGPYPVPNKTLHGWAMERVRNVRFFITLDLGDLIAAEGIYGMNELVLDIVGYDGIGGLGYRAIGVGDDGLILIEVVGELDLDDMKATFLVDPDR